MFHSGTVEAVSPPKEIEHSLVRAGNPTDGLLQRLVALALLYAIELAGISMWIEGALLAGKGGLAGFVSDWGAWILKGVVCSAGLFATFVWVKNKPALDAVARDFVDVPPNRSLAAAHVAAMALFGALSFFIYRTGPVSGLVDAALLGWFAAGLAGIVFGALAFIPARFWRRTVEGTGYLWAGALTAGIVACLAGDFGRTLWVPTAVVTFHLVRWLLTPFYAGVVADTATMTLGTQRFVVDIAPSCSGFEGMGLILVFGIVWLVLFRKESRFPQALLLVPGGVVVIYLLNAVRIALLIAIGDQGFEKVAIGGFHSQAGWIVFNVVALGFSVTARKLPWLSRVEAPRRVVAREQVQNPTAAWVVPFVAILAAGMLSRALTADFEWLYPLRFLAAVGAVWTFRKKYAKLDWSVSWVSPVAGVAVFAVWIAFDRAHTGGIEAMPAALANAPELSRTVWICFRVLAAAVTVPIAEELAFRGFLMRRVIASDFEAVPPRTFSWFAILVSSAVFGLLHGDRWFVGIAAGAVYALVMIRRGKMADAIVAHGITNALLAADVLLFQRWHLW